MRDQNENHRHDRIGASIIAEQRIAGKNYLSTRRGIGRMTDIRVLPCLRGGL